MPALHDSFLFVCAGADITPENYFGRTALQTAMHKGRIGAIRLLLTATNRRRDKMGDDMIDAIRRQDRHTVRLLPNCFCFRVQKIVRIPVFVCIHVVIDCCLLCHM